VAIVPSPCVLDDHWRLVGISFTVSFEDSSGSAFYDFRPDVGTYIYI